MLAPLLDHTADLVLGRRVPTDRSAWPAHARFANAVLARRLRRRYRVPLRDLGTMRAGWRRSLLSLRLTDRRFGYPLEMVLRAAAAGWQLREIEVDYRPRAAGTRSKVTGTVLGTARAARDMRRIMRAHHDATTPLYVTELGWGSASGPTRWQRGLWGQAEELSQAFEILSADRVRWGVAGAWWFTWADDTGGCGFCHTAGLLTENRKAKPSWYRFNEWTGGDPDAVPRAFFGE